MQTLPEALQPLAQYRQWITWRAFVRENGKIDKVPFDPRTGYNCDPINPENHMDARNALDAATRYNANVGFVFRADDPFFFLDIDHAFDGREWSPLAVDLLARFPEAAVEVSHSGTGLHIIGTAQPFEHGCRNQEYGLELYTADRFVALTGTHARGNAAADGTEAVQALAAMLFPPGSGSSVDDEQWTDEPVPEWNGPENDDELITRALRSSSTRGAFSGRATFRDLWEADEDALARCYPDPGGRGRDWGESEADAALAQHLAFWTGKDCERMARLMRESALYRDKWDDRSDYLPRTILKAVSQQGDVYQENRQSDTPAQDESVTPTGSSVSEPQTTGENIGTKRSGAFQFLSPDQQIEHFRGCVYIQSVHRIFTPDGQLLKPEQFKATYGGYIFAIDNIGDKTTKNAWEAFTESRAVVFPKAHSMTFRPFEKPLSIVREEGQTLLNTYIPLEIPMEPGDPSPVLDHLAKVLPNKRDQEIMLAYMAACVQHRGIKFQWAPLLQGMEGNGKTLFSRLVAYAVGQRYSHFPKAGDIDNKFNSWIDQKLFIGVEDVYVPEHKREVIETLKPMITGEKLEIQYKGADQLMSDVCANFILNSNHKDAIRKTATDRRFAVFYSAQQVRGDLTRWGMDGDYFPKLYNWLKYGGGYPIVAHFLANYPIPDELNPAGRQHRAPDTSSTLEAEKLTMGSIEQQIMEAVAEDRPGFAGDWISSMALDSLLKHARADRQVPPNRRRDMLRHLGYDYHPALHDGRVNNVVQPDGGKPRLFVRVGSARAELQTAGEASKAYEDDQQAGGPAPSPNGNWTQAGG